MMALLGHYRVLGELGRGGMGVVYKAHDPAVDREVAIKAFHLDDSHHDQLAKESLLREARAAGRLSHPNIVTVYHVLETDSYCYLVMELLQGDSLDEAHRKGIISSPNVIFACLSQAAKALDYAHGRGILHRDVKPQNLFLESSGILKVLDFGIAKQSGTTLTGQLTGTPLYMAPERLRGEASDGRADQFSLAVVAYELLTGAKPFHGDTLATVVSAVLFDKPKPANQVNTALTPTIVNALDRGLAKNAVDRYASCCDLVDALQAAPADPDNRGDVKPRSLLLRGSVGLAIAATAVGLTIFWFAARVPTPATVTEIGVTGVSKDQPRPGTEAAKTQPQPSPSVASPNLRRSGSDPSRVPSSRTVAPPKSSLDEVTPRAPSLNSPAPAVIEPPPTVASGSPTSTAQTTAPTEPTVPLQAGSVNSQGERSGDQPLAPSPANPAAAVATVRKAGVTQWIGTLAPNATLVLDGRKASEGRIAGVPVPPVSVTILELRPASITVKEAPSLANGWRLVLLNQGTSVPGLQIKWRTAN